MLKKINCFWDFWRRNSACNTQKITALGLYYNLISLFALEIQDRKKIRKTLLKQGRNGV